MEQKELDLVVTAKWIDEEGNEYEKNMQINDITHQQSIVIELKTVENIPVIEEKEEEQTIFPEVTDNIDRRVYVDMFPQMVNTYHFLKKSAMEKKISNELLTRQRMSAYYMYNMQAYWEYYANAAFHAVGQKIKNQDVSN